MKRGQTDLSLIVGVHKPKGLSSHDVVNACRRIFGEKRVGHAGTLDPLAEGVLLILVGPAARLNAYLESKQKSYIASITFGCATDTDDAEGTVIRETPLPSTLFDERNAQEVLQKFLGAQKQMPPAYSAIKVQGQKAYSAARKGTILQLQPRDIQVFQAELLGITSSGPDVSWDVRFSVSKGTYIRALARDIGVAAGSSAHLSGLLRETIGTVTLDDCVSLEMLESLQEKAALDPVAVCGFRFAFFDDSVKAVLQNGGAIAEQAVLLHEYTPADIHDSCACVSRVHESCKKPTDGERVLMIANNKVVAVYAYCAHKGTYTAQCVFSQPIQRGLL